MLPSIFKEFHEPEVFLTLYAGLCPCHRTRPDGKELLGRPLAVSRALCDFGCSSATTLIMKWLEFSGQKLAKCPDMICQASGHARGSVAPLGLDQLRVMWFLGRQRHAQTHVRSGEVVEGLKEDHTPPHLGSVLTETPTLATQRRQGMTQGEVEPLAQTGTDR